jgi:hypothetical protein
MFPSREEHSIDCNENQSKYIFITYQPWCHGIHEVVKGMTGV